MHPWNVSVQEAIAIQQQLQDRIVRTDSFGRINTVAGVDVGFKENGAITRAAVVVLHLSSLSLLEVATARARTTFPYVPGLLSFRELPAVLKAVDKLGRMPDMFLCDGQGYAHPRRFGIACHLGLLTDTPAIGVGKTRLVGTHAEPANRRGDWEPLYDGDEVIGAVLRTRINVKPVYVSIGHRISLPTAVDYVMKCTTRYKLPETTRLAHKHASCL